MTTNQLTVGGIRSLAHDHPGLPAHGSTEVGGRLRVLDIWESRAHFDRFVESRLQGAMGQAVGDRAGVPQIEEMELHTFYTR